MSSTPDSLISSRINPENLQKFFDRAEEILGKENVSRDASYGALAGPKGQTVYEDPFPLRAPRIPSGAVRPASVSEVQAVLKLANELAIPLWTVSRGKNLGYGGSAPVVNGSVVLDLRRINSILEINEEYGYAIVEPGVSFFDLYEEIQRRNLNLWLSVPALGWGSVLGNALERGFGYTPEGDHVSAQCGMEVVLANGDLVRTSMGALDGNVMFPLYKGGYGPGLDSLFHQSNFGVVTKIGMHLYPSPEAFIRCIVTVPLETDLIPLCGTLSDLIRRRVISNYPTIFGAFQSALVSKDQTATEKIQYYTKQRKPVPEEILETWRKRWGSWNAHFGLYGAAEVVPGLLSALQRALKRIPGAVLRTEQYTAKPGEFLHPDEVGVDLLPQNGKPSLASLAVLDLREEGGGHLSFSPLIPPSGREVYEWYLGAKKLTEKWGFNVMLNTHVYGRFLIPINMVMFGPQEKDKATSLYNELIPYTKSVGYTEYRTHVSYMHEIAKHQDFNNGAFGRLTTALKDTLDPKGILSPGKSGIYNSTAQ